MSEHEITVVRVQKMDAVDPLWTWHCSCGRDTNAVFGWPGHAEDAGLRHKRDKEQAA